MRYRKNRDGDGAQFFGRTASKPGYVPILFKLTPSSVLVVPNDEQLVSICERIVNL